MSTDGVNEITLVLTTPKDRVSNLRICIRYKVQMIRSRLTAIISFRCQWDVHDPLDFSFRICTGELLQINGYLLSTPLLKIGDRFMTVFSATR